MNDFFRHQLEIYADHHRDPRNCVAHHVGIPSIFLGVLLPLALWRIPIAGLQPSAAVVLVIPAAIGWIAMDAGLGAALLLPIALLVIAAEWIVRMVGPSMAWSLSAVLVALGLVLLAIGHAVFERRRPAAAGNVFQLFIGPIFVTAQVVVALGLRQDLAVLLQGRASPATGSGS